MSKPAKSHIKLRTYMKKETDAILPEFNNTTKTIIFTHGGGRFGNQMFSYAHLLAFSLEHKNIDFINIACWEYSDLLTATYTNFICSRCLDRNRHYSWYLLYLFCKYLSIKNNTTLKNIIIHLLYFYGGNYFAKYYHAQSLLVKKPWTNETLLAAKTLPNLDLANPESFDLINQANITFLSGWELCDWKLVEKHQIEIRNSLQINQKYTEISQSFISDLRKKYNLIIGIMIRQGDYQQWEDGKYYFTTEQYINWINQINEILQHQGKIGFVIASDTKQELSTFNNPSIHCTTGIAGGQGHYIESLVQLSLCDAVVSPPSSFSMWATFLGNIPFVPLNTSEQVITQEQLRHNSWLDFISTKC
jgi:Glycosyl transferase family 11